MSWLLKLVLGKVSGPILIYVIVGLFASNALTGYLLKSAWKKNAVAVLECENQALRNANAKNLAVAAELQRIQTDLIAEKESRRVAGIAAEKEVAARLAAKEIEHAEAIANMEIATNEITDEEWLCASEPVPNGLRNGMRDAAATYNRNRNNPSTGIPSDRNSSGEIAAL